jgi:hypothetical protein
MFPHRFRRYSRQGTGPDNGHCQGMRRGHRAFRRSSNGPGPRTIPDSVNENRPSPHNRLSGSGRTKLAYFTGDGAMATDESDFLCYEPSLGRCGRSHGPGQRLGLYLCTSWPHWASGRRRKALADGWLDGTASATLSRVTTYAKSVCRHWNDVRFRDGSTTFNLPDDRGLFERGLGAWLRMIRIGLLERDRG